MLRGIRARTTASAVVALLVFGAFIGVAAYVLVSQLAWSSLQTSVATRLDEVTGMLTSAEAESGTPDLEAMEVASPVGVQVVDGAGNVLESSPGLPDDLRLCEDPSGYLVLSQTVERPSGLMTVCAGAPTQAVERTQESVLVLLAAFLPLVIAGVAVVVWRAVGRALGSVEHLREQAEEIGGVEDASLLVQQTGDEVERLGLTLNDLLDRLHAQSRSTRQFIADAGHELRNPLATMRVALEFEESPGPSHQVALEELDRLELLVQDLLILARSDAHEQAAAEAVDLLEVSEASVRAHAGMRDGIDLRVVGERCTVTGDPRALRQVVDNLVANAVRHAHTAVTVSLAEEARACTLRVDDDGAGIDAADCERVFERFVRLDDARDRDEGGSGLGLSIVAAHVRTHHGTVMAEPGPGGHLVVTLPINGESGAS